MNDFGNSIRGWALVEKMADKSKIRVQTESGVREVFWPEGVEFVPGTITMRGSIPELTALHIEQYGGTEVLHPILWVGSISRCVCPDCVGHGRDIST